MKSSFRLSSLIAFAVMAFAVAFSFIEPVLIAVVATARAVKNLALDGFKLAANQGEGTGRTLVRLVQAKAFVLRLIERERPNVSNSWRMCPST